MYYAILDDKSFKKTLFDMFGKDMLIESLLKVEDSVRIAIISIISEYLPEYFQHSKTDRIITNLLKTLQMSDEIEGSVIFAFNLINSIFHHPLFDVKKTNFKFS